MISLDQPVNYFEETEQDSLLQRFLTGVGETLRKPLTEVPLEPVSTYQETNKLTPLTDYSTYEKFRTPVEDIPNVLKIPLTEKFSQVFSSTPDISAKRSVFMMKPLYSDTKFKGREVYSVDNTLMNNPVVTSLEQVNLQPNQLNSNLADTTTSISGHESVLSPFLMNYADTQSTPDKIDEVVKALPAPLNAASVFTDKDVRNQTFLFLIGLVILAIGIFALTR